MGSLFSDLEMLTIVFSLLVFALVTLAGILKEESANWKGVNCECVTVNPDQWILWVKIHFFFFLFRKHEWRQAAVPPCGRCSESFLVRNIYSWTNTHFKTLLGLGFFFFRFSPGFCCCCIMYTVCISWLCHAVVCCCSNWASGVSTPVLSHEVTTCLGLIHRQRAATGGVLW